MYKNAYLLMFDLKIWWYAMANMGIPLPPPMAPRYLISSSSDHDTHPTTTTTPLRYVYK